MGESALWRQRLLRCSAKAGHVGRAAANVEIFRGDNLNDQKYRIVECIQEYLRAQTRCRRGVSGCPSRCASHSKAAQPQSVAIFAVNALDSVT